MRSRLRCASALGCRFRVTVFEIFTAIANNFATGESLRLSDAIDTETDSVLLDAAGTRQYRRSFLEPAYKEKTNGEISWSSFKYAAIIRSNIDTTDEVLSGVELRGKRILVTGVSAGLGVETARSLVAHGAHVVGAARDLNKAEQATAQVQKDAKANDGKFKLIELDLANLKSVRACADALLKKGEPFDVVIANAGVMATPFGHTADGFETQFGTNHLGHFVLVNRIAPSDQRGRTA